MFLSSLSDIIDTNIKRLVKVFSTVPEKLNNLFFSMFYPETDNSASGGSVSIDEKVPVKPYVQSVNRII